MRTGPSPGKIMGAALIVLALAGLPDAGAPAARAAGAPAPLGIDASGASRNEYADAAQEWVFRGAPLVVARGTLRIAAPELLYHGGAHQLEVLGSGTCS